MTKRLLLISLTVLVTACAGNREHVPTEDFIKIDGADLVLHGEKFFIRGPTWKLAIEGYMFGFQETNSAGWIDRMFRELAGGFHGRILELVQRPLHNMQTLRS